MTGALVFATAPPVIDRTMSLESIAMRLYQQIRASIARSAVAAAGLVVFVSGMPLSASGQTARAQGTSQLPPIATAPAPPGTPIGIDEAVKMALENNLNIQVEKLNPQIQVLGVTRAQSAYGPALFTNFSRRSSTSPPTDFNTAGSDQQIQTSGNFSTTGGLQQNLR